MSREGVVDLESLTGDELAELVVHGLQEVNASCIKYLARHKDNDPFGVKHIAESFISRYDDALDDIARGSEPFIPQSFKDDFMKLSSIGERNARHPEHSGYTFANLSFGLLGVFGLLSGAWSVGLPGLVGFALSTDRQSDLNSNWQRQIHAESEKIYSVSYDVWKLAFSKIYNKRANE